MPGEVWILCTEAVISRSRSYIIMINETTNNRRTIHSSSVHKFDFSRTRALNVVEN